jgi:iron only hydrogenase large subunit-like protein
MNGLNPIYTEKRECQDCYKCVRNCPVKAIRVQEGCATVVPEMCVLCGQCVEVCPSSAKKVRDDLPHVRQLLTGKRRVFVSLAPSYVAEFPGIRPAQMVRALTQLGFAGVSETALGAQQVSAHVARMLAEQPDRVLLSSACPTVVAYLQKHRPELMPMVSGLMSPLLAHCRMLRESYGNDIGVVFIGPCISKKTEADDHPELLDVALTFEDLQRWFEQDKLNIAALPAGDADRFVPESAQEGAVYPVDGGMIAGIRANCAVNDCSFMCFSGISAIHGALAGIDRLQVRSGLFIELLACEGGCINGPKVNLRGQTAIKRFQILQNTSYPQAEIPRRPVIEIARPLVADAPHDPPFTDLQVREALKAVGKRSVDDELNCGGCGYDSCRGFGHALLAGRAERSMCVTYMRKLAYKKANALVHKMPSAVVIVDESLRILECNAAFSRLIKPGARPVEESQPALEGTLLSAHVPFHNLFSNVLRSGDDIVDKDLRFRDTIVHLSIFTIDKHAVVGGIIQDITRPAVQKEQVIKRAQEVIQKNLATVQKIAYLLGENAAESEITLNSIIESFTPPKLDEDPGAADNAWRKLYRR